jgi:hypothetical protein
VSWTVPLGGVASIGASTASSDGAAEHWLEAAGALLVALAVAVAWEVRGRRRSAAGGVERRDRWSLPTTPGRRR